MKYKYSSLTLFLNPPYQWYSQNINEKVTTLELHNSVHDDGLKSNCINEVLVFVGKVVSVMIYAYKPTLCLWYNKIGQKSNINIY